jgi:hypothetical protein
MVNSIATGGKVGRPRGERAVHIFLDRLDKPGLNHTEPWGKQVTAIEIKDIVFPDNAEPDCDRSEAQSLRSPEGSRVAPITLVGFLHGSPL